MKRKIAVFTGNRAEYGMLKPILKEIALNKKLSYQLIVSGAHLDKKFGRTIGEIKGDGFVIAGKVDITSTGDSLFDTTQAIGKGIISLGKLLKMLKPDLFLVYADRFESFAALIASTQMGIPTAHAEGGDITEGGALDDMVRHAMSKLAHLHFTTNADASQRLVRMGEEPWRIFTVGYPGVDLIKAGDFTPPDELVLNFKIDLSRPLVLCTQHSIATQADEALKQIDPVIQAMRKLAHENIHIIMTFPNNDAGGLRIMDSIKKKSKQCPNLSVFESVGRRNYYGLLNICGRVGRGVCVGNSSSGIKDTPAFGCPTVNIGNRQKGRLRAANCIDTGYNAQEIYHAIKKCLFDTSFRKHCSNCRNPYGKGDVGKRISKILTEVPLTLELVQKKLTY